MCGIAGVLCAATLNDDDVALLKRINGTLLHRGPDSEGLFRSGQVALAMRRLSIVDLAGGQQPIANETDSVTVICNGEIYNHKKLRSDLLARGHRFRSHSDVETIVHLYEEEGEDCVLPLRGMYALALWDAPERRLLLARDRLGEKPLYLYRDRRPDGAERLWFASELTALLNAVPPERRRLSAAAINEFFTFQYVLEPGTPVEGIVQLPPGHVLSLSPDALDASPRRYWSVLDIPAAAPEDPVDAVRNWLSEACRRMGTADVPVGVALSGGIDSSLVAAITARHYPGQIQAFSVGYPGRPATDERSIAQRFARSIGIPFAEIEINIEEIVGEFPALVAAMDTPVADIAAYGYYAVSRAAREAGVPVLLTGMGGDEVFWGYDWVRAAVASANGNGRARWWAPFVPGAPKARRPSSIFEVHDELRRGDTLARGLRGGAGSIAEDHWLAATRLAADAPADLAVSETLNRTWLLSNCLTLVDRMSMAHSVEPRVPFLDIDLVNGIFAARRAGLGDWMKPHKWLLLEAAGDLLPPEIKFRPKQGFTPPVQAWMQAIVERWRHLWEEDSALVRYDAVDREALRRMAPQMPISFLYKLTMLESWTRSVFEPSHR